MTRLHHTPKIIFLCHLIFLCFLFTPVHAKETPPPVKNDYEELKQKLIKDGFSPDTIQKIYDNPKTELALKSVSLYFIHNEGKLNYDQFLAAKEVKKARAFLKKHETVFSEVEEKYGVDKHVIVSIMAVETRLGTYLGDSSILNTLSTLAATETAVVKEKIWDAIPEKKRYERERFEKKAVRKSKWAYEELKSYLKYTEKEKIDPVTVRGSYAGAFGISQFMPSNALTLAQDGNNDGKVDLFETADAVASIAYYLKRYGWKPGINEKDAYDVLYHYNHSKYYVNTLLKLSEKLRGKKL